MNAGGSDPDPDVKKPGSGSKKSVQSNTGLNTFATYIYDTHTYFTTLNFVVRYMHRCIFVRTVVTSTSSQTCVLTLIVFFFGGGGIYTLAREKLI